MLSYIYPVASGGRLTSPFGYRDTSKLPAGASKYHEGIDIAAPAGTGVLAALSGKVIYTGNDRSKGNYIIVDHGNGTQTEYEHLNSIVARAGQAVSAGQKIGTVGSTGVSTGNHLDFRVKINGSYIDPLKWKPSGSSGTSAASAVAGTVGANSMNGVNINADNLLSAVKENWLLIAGGILIIAILTR